MSTPLPDVTLITGPLVLGFMFGTGLYGILIVQVFMYHTNYPNDPKWIKIYVGVIFLLETVFTVLSTIAAWDTLGKGWGDPSQLSNLDWSTAPLPPMSGLVTTMVHAFYCWRIYKLTRHVALPLLIMAISLMQLSGTIALMVHLGIYGLDISAVESAYKIVTVWLTGAAVADIIVAITMVVILLRASKKVGFQPTASKLHRLIRVVVETGVITSCGAILDCTLYLRFKNTNLHFIMFYMLAKMYSNTIMATLNARGSSTAHGASQGVGTDHHSGRNEFWADQNTVTSQSRSLGYYQANVSKLGSVGLGPSLTDRIHISTETAVDRDGSEETELKTFMPATAAFSSIVRKPAAM